MPSVKVLTASQPNPVSAALPRLEE